MNGYPGQISCGKTITSAAVVAALIQVLFINVPEHNTKKHTTHTDEYRS